jgi:sulfotransferase famil protein
MIISHAHRFIFIKTNKTAGTSIEAALTAICGDQDVITPFRAENEQYRTGRGPQNYRIDHPLKPKRPLWRTLLARPERYWHPSVGFYEHMPAWRIRDYVGEEVWRSYYKFAFDRNPWDRQVSWYFYKTKSKRRRPSFEQFMRSRIAFVRNYELYAMDGDLAVDFVGRFETLHDDLASVLKTIGVSEELALPKTNVSDSGDYRSYYTPELRDRVASWYAPEIKLLGYAF